MTRQNPSPTVPFFLSGLWGEALAVSSLVDLGFRTNWTGGLAPLLDLTAVRGDSTFLVQVKTTRSVAGWIRWNGNGDKARAFQDRAVELGLTGAIYVFVQISSPGDHEFNLESGVLMINLPKTYSVTAGSALMFGRHVDLNRAHYAKERRTRGPRRGELFTEDHLAYPANSEAFPPLRDFVEKFLPHVSDLDEQDRVIIRASL